MRTLSPNGSLINATCTDLHHDRRIGAGVFHVHTNALALAGRLNQRAGLKWVRVAVIDSHFHIVLARSGS